MKEELGLDHFEGRSWQGLHRHALMTMIATPSSSIAGSQQQGGKKRINGPPPSPNSSLDYRLSDARIVENGFATSGGLSKSAKVVLVHVLAKLRLARGSPPAHQRSLTRRSQQHSVVQKIDTLRVIDTAPGSRRLF
jgi:hypothetical protein